MTLMYPFIQKQIVDPPGKIQNYKNILTTIVTTDLMLHQEESHFKSDVLASVFIQRKIFVQPFCESVFYSLCLLHEK